LTSIITCWCELDLEHVDDAHPGAATRGVAATRAHLSDLQRLAGRGLLVTGGDRQRDAAAEGADIGLGDARRRVGPRGARDGTRQHDRVGRTAHVDALLVGQQRADPLLERAHVDVHVDVDDRGRRVLAPHDDVRGSERLAEEIQLTGADQRDVGDRRVADRDPVDGRGQSNQRRFANGQVHRGADLGRRRRIDDDRCGLRDSRAGRAEHRRRRRQGRGAEADARNHVVLLQS